MEDAENGGVYWGDLSRYEEAEGQGQSKDESGWKNKVNKLKEKIEGKPAVDVDDNSSHVDDNCHFRGVYAAGILLCIGVIITLYALVRYVNLAWYFVDKETLLPSPTETEAEATTRKKVFNEKLEIWEADRHNLGHLFMFGVFFCAIAPLCSLLLCNVCEFMQMCKGCQEDVDVRKK